MPCALVGRDHWGLCYVVCPWCLVSIDSSRLHLSCVRFLPFQSSQLRQPLDLGWRHTLLLSWLKKSVCWGSFGMVYAPWSWFALLHNCHKLLLAGNVCTLVAWPPICVRVLLPNVLHLCPPRRNSRLRCLCFPPLLAKHMLAWVSASSLAWTRHICLHPNSPLWPNTCLDLLSLRQVNPSILFASPLDLSSQTHSLGLQLIVDSAGTLPYCLHSIHLRAFALAHASIPAGIQRPRLHPLLLCLATNPFLCHPFFRFGQHGLIRHASSEQWTILFPLPRQKPHLCGFTAVP